MSKNSFALCIGTALLLCQFPALADFTGCADSPENPTAVLALLGATAGGVNYVLNRRRARRSATKAEAGEGA